jgi:hypothetical protein
MIRLLFALLVPCLAIAADAVLVAPDGKVVLSERLSAAGGIDLGQEVTASGGNGSNFAELINTSSGHGLALRFTGDGMQFVPMPGGAFDFAKACAYDFSQSRWRVGGSLEVSGSQYLDGVHVQSGVNGTDVIKLTNDTSGNALAVRLTDDGVSFVPMPSGGGYDFAKAFRYNFATERWLVQGGVEAEALHLGGGSATEISADADFSAEAEGSLPTKGAVKAYVDQAVRAPLSAIGFSAGGQALPANEHTVINYEVVEPGDEGTVTTGPDWQFHVPRDGIYHLSAGIGVTDNFGWQVLEVHIDGARYARIAQNRDNMGVLSGTVAANLHAGQIVQFVHFTTGVNQSVYSDPTLEDRLCWFSIVGY